MIQTPQFCIRFQRNDLRKVKCEPAIQTRSYYLLDSINLLDYRSRLMSFTLTIFPNPLRVTEKFGSISFAWFDRYNPQSPQINNISPYLGPPISGDNIHALYIISTLLHTSLQLVLASNLPIWCELGAKACKRQSLASRYLSCTYKAKSIRNPKNMRQQHINTSY